MNPFVKLSLWCAVMAVLVLGTFAGALALGYPQGDAAAIAFIVAVVVAAVAVVVAAVAATTNFIAVFVAAAIAFIAAAVAAVAAVVAANFIAVAAVVAFAAAVVVAAAAEEFDLKKRWAFTLLGAEAASITVAMLAFGSPSGIATASIAIAALLLGIGMLGRARALRPPSAA